MISESRILNYDLTLQARKELQGQGNDGGLCVCDCQGEVLEE